MWNWSLENPCRYSHSGPEYPNTDLAIHIEWRIGLPWSHMNSSGAFFKRTHPWGHKNEALLEKVCVWLDFWTPKMRSTIRPSKTWITTSNPVIMPPGAFCIPIGMHLCLCSSSSILKAFVDCLWLLILIEKWSVLGPWKSVQVQPFRTWIPQYRLSYSYRMAHRASMVPYE